MKRKGGGPMRRASVTLALDGAIADPRPHIQYPPPSVFTPFLNPPKKSTLQPCITQSTSQNKYNNPEHCTLHQNACSSRPVMIRGGIEKSIE